MLDLFSTFVKEKTEKSSSLSLFPSCHVDAGARAGLQVREPLVGAGGGAGGCGGAPAALQRVMYVSGGAGRPVGVINDGGGGDLTHSITSGLAVQQLIYNPDTWQPHPPHPHQARPAPAASGRTPPFQ